jgi:putative protease
LSGYFNHRDPNQGTCTNSCRWDYKVHDAKEDDTGDITLAADSITKASADPQPSLGQRAYLIEEPNRPGEHMPIEEDEHGTYILNSKDLRALEHVHRLVEIGVDCLKIEGRTKSHYYVARTAQVYRKAIDDAAAGKPFDPSLLAVLENLANRGYTDGFYQRHHSEEYQNYIQGNSQSLKQKFVGEITGYDAQRGAAEVLVKNKITVGDTIEVILPDGNYTTTVERMENDHGAVVDVAPGSGHTVWMPMRTDQVKNGLIAVNLPEN